MSMKGSSCMWPWFCSWWPSYVASSSATGKTEFTRACLTSLPSHQVSCLLLCVSVEFWMPFLTSCWFGTIAPWQSVKVSSSAMDPGQKLSDETTVCKRLFTPEDVTLLLSHEKSLINNGFNKLSPGPVPSLQLCFDFFLGLKVGGFSTTTFLPFCLGSC